MIKKIFPYLSIVFFYIPSICSLAKESDPENVTSATIGYVPTVVTTVTSLNEETIEKYSCRFSTQNRIQITRLQEELARGASRAPSNLRADFRQFVTLKKDSGESSFFFWSNTSDSTHTISEKTTNSVKSYLSFEKDVVKRIFIGIDIRFWQPLDFSKPACNHFPKFVIENRMTNASD